MTELNTIIRQAAGDSLSRWGRDVHEAVDDLVQDLWLWYYATPSLQARVGAADTDAGVRRSFTQHAFQLLSKQQLESDVFGNRVMYSVEAVKAALAGTSTNRYLLRILPAALADLERQNGRYRESVRLRYEDDAIPHGPQADNLRHALVALTKHINVEYITDDTGAARFTRNSAVTAEARRGSGGYSDPTADTALGLIAKGDEVLELTDKDGNVTGTTTYREEFLADGFSINKADHRSGADRDTLSDENFSDIERAALYKAQVFPELFPDEKPMMLENWHSDDREAYCGGTYTPGYRKFSVVR